MSGDTTTAPVMMTITTGVIVQAPEGYLKAPEIGPLGAVSVGPGHVPGTGNGAVHVAIHGPDGTVLLATLGAPAFNMFARLMNQAADALQRGDFNQPERMQ